MENKLTLEFVVNQIQDNGNTSASLVSVEHKPDRKITVSWTTKSKSIFLYVDVEFPTHFTPFGFRCLPKSIQCNWFVKSYQIQLDNTKSTLSMKWWHYIMTTHELRHYSMWSCITVDMNKDEQLFRLIHKSINLELHSFYVSSCHKGLTLKQNIHHPRTSVWV